MTETIADIIIGCGFLITVVTAIVIGKMKASKRHKCEDCECCSRIYVCTFDSYHVVCERDGTVDDFDMPLYCAHWRRKQ